MAAPFVRGAEDAVPRPRHHTRKTTRHLLLPAPEAEWAQLPAEEHEKGMRSHEQFHRDLSDGGHTIVVTAPLEPSAQATSMRPGRQRRDDRHHGPFTESVEQVVGFYLLESEDETDLRACAERFASRGELIELRRLAE